MFEVYLLKKAEKELEELPNKIQIDLKNNIKSLSKFPSVRNCKKITGYENTFRLRSGKYRVLFKVYNEKNAIVIVKVEHRGKIYKNL